jgi:FdhD protein
MSDQGLGILRVGISSCLLGERVRYNGDHKRADYLAAMSPPVEWIPVCPEVEIGMGVPREPVRLERSGGATRMMGLESRSDYTERMNRWAERRIGELIAAGICGYVLKKDSPSCGLSTVKIFEKDRVDPGGRGLFASALVARLPRLPVEEEDRLADARVREDFLARCRAYRDTQPLRRVRVVKFGRGAGERDDAAATEEPLEVRLHGKPFAVIMRTPGADRELAAGFLFAEGVINGADDLGAVEVCRHPEHPGNIVDAYLMGAAADAVAAHLDDRRRVLTTSSCGLCGRTTIESLRVRASPLPQQWVIPAAMAAALPQKLRGRQSVFDETGGLHAAAVFDLDAACEASAEDVGRHNAVDKAIGSLLLQNRLPLNRHVLVVSGRASYEIVQKAWLAGIACVCAVSAPSTLAIDLADEAGITLLGFVRDGGFNAYAHPGRIRAV